MKPSVEKVKHILQITDSEHDDLIDNLIDLAADDFQAIRGADDELPTMELTITLMVGYQLHTRGLGGILKSKSMGVLAIEYTDAAHGYPVSIVKRIPRLQTVK